MGVSATALPKHKHWLPLFYILFGALHEVSHLVVALLLGFGDGLVNDGVVALLYRTLLGRQCILPALDNVHADTDTDSDSTAALLVVRHAGWLFSVLLALVLKVVGQGKRQTNVARYARLAANVTALEAVSTDLFQFGVLAGLFTRSASAGATLFCGNFGIILLHQAWLSDNGKTALDVLEKMVQVTMMRGAQSGGVIAFTPTSHKSKDLRGIRSRVVNKKRTDLSVYLRNKVQRDVFGILPRSPYSKYFVPTFSGHTRFATSSKATMEGTHPQQWTPPSSRRVYDFSVPHSGRHVFEPTCRSVSNFVTHNGDFDFYVVNGKTYDLEVIQMWLVQVTGSPMQAPVDSAAVAGLVDILRTQGCFGLSARYAVCLGLPTSKIRVDAQSKSFPQYSFFEQVGLVFEDVLAQMLKTATFEGIAGSPRVRQSFAQRVVSKLEGRRETLVQPIDNYITDEEGGASLVVFCEKTIDAFFDNDLFTTTRMFLKNAKGSFGLCFTSSLDAHRQFCLAARGQTMSIAFYPTKGLICYGSEQAAVKAGLKVDFPGNSDVLGRSSGDVDNDALRLDLDDLGGEIICLDWGSLSIKSPPVSTPNRGLVEHELMNGRVQAILFQESKATTQDPQIYHRMTRLSRNRFIKPLPEESKDPILSDIQDIPKVCQAIQDEWKSDRASSSLNRLTAYNLSRCLRTRLEAHVAGKVHPRAIDILLTGCEVSLWLAEQFASDLQKSFPALRIKAVSSNKLLGLYGQEIAVPCLGFAYGQKTCNLHDTIVIIVSHSGGTFAPLSCSNLLQSSTKNIFVVTSEWDTQIGKQLHAMDKLDESEDQLCWTKVFSTEVGMRPAEPCSVSVVATHQLLTNLFEYICVVILSDHRFRRATAAVISEEDLLVLERCNQSNIDALADIIGVSKYGFTPGKNKNRTETELREAGDVWADHVLENARAYIMTFIYIFSTVTSGYPVFYAMAYAAGLDKSNDWIYLIHALDAAIYFWLPQINITILRLLQGRNLRHRMVGRTVVIGDIPWVAQSADAFLSKIFACSYSIAGLNVLSGNPADHFVHRHTHRVVRGSLIICGRADGRLSALSTTEAAVCLSVNQASSIQSFGGTCESITVGHNPFKLPLSAKGIFLKRKRPLFLCERMLVETDVKEEKNNGVVPDSPEGSDDNNLRWSTIVGAFKRRTKNDVLNLSLSRHHDSSVRPRLHKRRSAVALLGAYMDFEDENEEDDKANDDLSVDRVIANAIHERKWSDRARKLFQALDISKTGFLSEEEFIEGSYRLKGVLSEEQARTLFKLVDSDESGQLDYDEFLNLLQISDLDSGIKLPPSNRNDRGIIQIEPSKEKYFGETLRKYNAGKARKDVDFMLARSQHFSQELYETRIASVQRFVAMTVLFHQMGKRVQEFFAKISFGLLGYRMDRTHSIMRIATTASPISGADVRQRMRQIQLLKKVQHSVHVIAVAYLQFKVKKEKERVRELERNTSNRQLDGRQDLGTTKLD